MKKVVSIFMCAMMLFMMNPVTSHASGTWYKTTFSKIIQKSVTSSSFKSNGNIICHYYIKDTSGKYTVTCTLQEYNNGTWQDVVSRKHLTYFAIDSKLMMTTEIFNDEKYTGTYRIKISCGNNCPRKIWGEVHYFQKNN